MKIRTAIFLVYVAACALGYLVLMWFMLAEVRPRYVNALHGQLETSAKLLAVTIGGRDDWVTLQETLSKTGSGARVRLIANDGSVLLDTLEPVEGSRPEYSGDSGAGLLKRAALGILDRSQSGVGEIAGVASLRLSDGRPVRLVLSRPFRGVNALIWAERKKLGFIAFCIAVIMLAAGWWIATKLTDSIERLTLYAQAVRDGRVAVPPRSQAKEIAALSEAFEQMRDTLEGRQHAERYTRALAHEVKAPLTAIRGAAELLEEPMSEEQRSKFLSHIREGSARIARIIERLLELTSLESRKFLETPASIPTMELLTEVRDTMKTNFESSNVSLKIDAVTAGHLVGGDRFLLRQALVNLLQNALEFSASGQSVSLRVLADSRRITFVVEDEGPGVPDYAIDRVFERFYSLPRPGTDRKSTGIGLSLVREIAHLHGGDAELQNRATGGCSARLWVPLVAEV